LFVLFYVCKFYFFAGGVAVGKKKACSLGVITKANPVFREWGGNTAVLPPTEQQNNKMDGFPERLEA